MRGSLGTGRSLSFVGRHESHPEHQGWRPLHTARNCCAQHLVGSALRGEFARRHATWHAALCTHGRAPTTLVLLAHRVANPLCLAHRCLLVAPHAQQKWRSRPICGRRRGVVGRMVHGHVGNCNVRDLAFAVWLSLHQGTKKASMRPTPIPAVKGACLRQGRIQA
jgi:hypothetical protein